MCMGHCFEDIALHGPVSALQIGGGIGFRGSFSCGLGRRNSLWTLSCRFLVVLLLGFHIYHDPEKRFLVRRFVGIFDNW